MIFHFIKIIFLSAIFSTRFFDQNQDITLGNNRSCAERPSLDNTLISPSGNFLIHYNDYYEGITDFANEVPTKSDPINPGPLVKAIALISFIVTPACFNA